MIPKRIWVFWYISLKEYAKKYYPEIKVTEKKIIEIFDKCYTLEMEMMLDRLKMDELEKKEGG